MRKLTKALFIFYFLIGIESISQNTSIPDDNFEQALIDLGYDSGPLDDVVITANINTINILDISSKNISDLTGIEDFTALSSLYCGNNNLTNLDLSNNTSLINLFCNGNNLSSLDFSNNADLEYLNCDNSNVNSLNISNNNALTTLWCRFNNLNTLDVSNNSALKILICYNNNLSTLNVNTNTNLTNLQCENNNLTTLDVSNNINLEGLTCSGNSISNLDVSNNTVLSSFYCSSNNLSSLDLSFNTVLKYFYCDSNNLSSLNIKNGNNTNIDGLYFHSNNNPLLVCIEVDDVNYSNTNWTNIDLASSFSTNCSTFTIEDTINLDLDFYPNPVTNILKIESSYIIDKIKISTLHGINIFTTNKNKIDFSSFKSGVYLITIKSGNKEVTKKIIKY